MQKRKMLAKMNPKIELWPHQKAAAERIRNREICALWFSMRCGKTLAAIAGTDDGDRLIVCPTSVKGVWSGDLKAWGQDSYIFDRNNIPAGEPPRNVIVNYESLWRTPLLSWPWDSIIFDESLRLQNMRTKLWAYISRCLPYISESQARVLLLSGTPCPEGFHQIITQAIIGTGSYCGASDPWQVLRENFTYDDKKYKWTINQGHKAQAAEVLRKMGPAMTQAEAGILTKKLYRTMRIPLADAELRLWMATPAAESPATQAMYAQSIASGRPIKGEIKSSAKLDAVAEYAEELDGQCVIMTHFTESLLYLQRRLPTFSTIYGGDNGANYRTETIAGFNAGSIRGIIANVATVKVGLNLSAASCIIFAENDYSGEARIQAEERATVHGKEAVEIIDFVSEVPEGLRYNPDYRMLGEIDNCILTAVRSKKDFNSRLLRSL
jgi:hypothetical protein